MNKTEEQFHQELLDLLDKWQVEFEAVDHTKGWTDGGCDYHIEAYAGALFDQEGNTIRDTIKIDFGAFIFPRPPAGD